MNRYWASRQGNIRLNKSAHPGWAMTVDADSVTELENRINAQKEYEQILPNSQKTFSKHPCVTTMPAT